MRPSLTKAQAVLMISLIASKNGIADAFEIYDDRMLEITLENLARRVQAVPADWTAEKLFSQWVHEEFGLFEPTDPHEMREFEMSFR